MVTRVRSACRQSCLLGLLFTALAIAAGCDKVQLTAPTESTIQLFANGASVPLNGSVGIVGTVIEASGTPVQNGTVVTFTTTLGRIDPSEARTNNGRVTVQLISDGRSGTARITAISGGATSDALEIPVGGAAAANVTLRADPGSVGANGGTVQLVAIVRDESGNPVAGVPVTFSTTAGQIAASSSNTDANGEARTTLTTTREATVTARAGAQEATATVTVQAAPTVAVTVTPTTPVAGQPVTFAIQVTPATNGNPVQSMTIDFGDGDRRTIGSGGSTSVAHVYAQAGTYTVTVTVRDTAGQETSQVTIIAVTPPAAVPVDVAVSTPAPTAGAPVSFTATATPATGATVSQYQWTFGDNSATQTTTGPTATHVYAAAGAYTVNVRVTGTDGSEGFGQTAVTVAPPAP
jgi:PKD repeat protein